ncbi:MAG: hypothetical protein AAF726_16665 [Planctomycetota bacterium]
MNTRFTRDSRRKPLVSRSIVPLSGLALFALTGWASADVKAHSSNITLLSAPPSGALPTSDVTAFLFKERSRRVLAIPIEVDSVSMESYAPVGSGSSPAAVLPAGTVVSSYLIHADTSTLSSLDLSVGVLFDEPIVALIWDRTRLAASDAQLGAPSVVYPTESYRGLEDILEPDSVEQWMRRASARMQVGAQMDQLRILTAPSLAFSLDRSSDCEFRDPNADGDETIDCGDIVLESLGTTPGVFLDDEEHLPVHGPSAPGAGPPTWICSGSSVFTRTLDIDAIDDIGLNIKPLIDQQQTIFRDQVPLDQRGGIYDTSYFLISYDDDGDEGWTACTPSERTPVESSSPVGATYGTTGGRDELWRLELAGSTVVTLAPERDELDVHRGLAPNPDAGDLDDDDVDALDWLRDGEFVYFSVDSEGEGHSMFPSLDMEAGEIWRARPGMLPERVLTPAQLGLPDGTDIDAFEFAWVPHFSGSMALGLVFSVDGDDLITLEDESGTFDPKALYASLLDGTNAPILTLGDDVDAIALYTIECEDPIGTRYCTPAVPNSTGAPGVIGAIGSTEVDLNCVRLIASDLPPFSAGFFIVSRTRGFIVGPGGSAGNLCVAGAIGRYASAIFVTGASGTATVPIDLGLTPTPTGPVPIAPGETWNFQCWHRDSVGGSTTSNFTDALEITFE